MLPFQTYGPQTVRLVVDAVGCFMVIFAPLSGPMVDGLDAITLIRYPVPNGVLAGIRADMLFAPNEILEIDPMLVGFAKLPKASLS